MKERKKMFQMKRILALLLAVAMTITAVPATAYASEVQGLDLEQSTETASAEETTKEAEQTTEENLPEASQEEQGSLQEVVLEEQESLQEVIQEEQSTSSEASQTEEETAQEITEETSGEAAASAVGETASDVKAVAVETLVTEISLNLEETERTKVYTGAEVFATIDSLKDLVKVTVDGQETGYDQADLTLAWKVVGEGGALSDLPAGLTAPIGAGTYNLSVKLAARESSYKAAEIEGGVKFIITPANVRVVPQVAEVKAGTKAGEIKAASADVTTTVSGKSFIYAVDDPATTDVNEAESSDLMITVTVREAADASKTALAADTVLLTNGDYVLDFAASFTEQGKTKTGSNYVISEIASQDVVMSDLITTYVNVTLAEKWKEAGLITQTYTGEKITEPAEGTDYTVKVQYADGADAQGQVVYKDIAGAELTEEWYVLKASNEYVDAEGHAETKWEWVKLEEAPTEAGSYVYRLSYAGQDGQYAAAYADIEVVIQPMKVVIQPTLEAGAVFYDDMEEADVLAQIDYQVYQAADPTKEVPVDKTTVWGTSYDSVSKTQPYEPVFLLQYEDKDEAGQVIYVDNNGAALDSTKKYRVIFSGKKSVVNANGTSSAADVIPINDVVNTTALNYNVETDYESVLSKYAEPITVTAGTKTTIDITAITEALGGKGDSLTNVYSRGYDGTALYADKAAYKKAVVKAEDRQIASDTDASLEYKWYKNSNDSITDLEYSDSTNEPYGEGEENLFDQEWDFYGYDIPVDAGIYKLEITYLDPERPEYRTSTANVYYVIEKQPVQVAFTGEYKALTDWTVSTFLSKSSLSDVKIQKKQGDTWVDMDSQLLGSEWYIEYKVLKTALVPKTDAEGNVVTDTEGNPVLVPETTTVLHYCDAEGTRYEILDAEGKPLTKEAESEMNARNTFEENAQYKLTATLHSYSSNYTTSEFVIREHEFSTTGTDGTAVTGKHKVRTEESLQEKAPITIEKMGTTELSVSVNEIALGEATKIYDGTAFDIAKFLGSTVSGNAASGNAVSISKVEDGSAVTDVVLDYTWSGNHWNGNRFYQTEGFTEAVHAGEYTLYASFAGNTTYKAISRTKIATVTITPARLTVSPVLNRVVVAGEYPYEVWDNSAFQEDLKFDGEAEVDKEAFIPKSHYYDDGEYRGYGYEAFDYGYVNFTTLDEEKNELDTYADVLKGEKTYTLVGINGLSQPYANNYELIFMELPYTTIRGVSEVESTQKYLISEYLTNKVNNDGEASAAIEVSVTGYTQMIQPVEAIPYSYYLDESGERVYGNFLEVTIHVPGEYEDQIPATAKYENSIEAQGGIVKTGTDAGEYITVLFDAAALDQKTFTIRWEDGYVENFVFDFTKAELMGNLAEAVAPKTIAFNSPATRMAVGEEQALDLKLTKVQFNDIVYIDYAVSDETILSVDDLGKVTALKVGTATVTASPAKLVNGKKVLIEGAKAATVKITVNPVTAPKIKKITARDNYAIVQYSVVPDGYRREIYVLEGKNVSTAVFEDKIAQMNNGQWEGIFATAPRFLSPSYESYYYVIKNGKVDKTTCQISVEGLEAGKTYTIYVRNVSAVRKADNGNNVTLSAQGTAKSLTTTLKQVDELRGSVEGLEKIGLTMWYENEIDTYTIPLSAGKAKISVEGRFAAKELDTSMDYVDINWEKLPLSADLKKIYVDPKLSYAVYERGYTYDESEGSWGYTYVSTKLASIDKKGNLKLAGVGTVFVKITDENTGCTAVVALRITAEADKVKGSTKKLSVGQGVYLEDLLTYFEGKKKLTGYFDRKVIIDQALIDAFDASDAFSLNPDTGYVTAVQPGGKFTINLTDSYVQERGGTATASVKLTSSVLEPVKNVKIANTKNLDMAKASLADDYAVVQFTYTGGAKAFKIEVKDERGRLIKSSYVQKAFMEENHRYVGKDKKVYYCWEINGLTQQSKYQVTITAVYGDVAAKAAKTTIKTTKVPLSTIRVRDEDVYGGETMYLMSGGTPVSLGSRKIISGNAYTLGLEDTSAMAKVLGSDSLTWSSSNKKVATIKANSGSIYASLKALKNGTTVIEVKSKITKEVISRQLVTITSVGDAYGVGRRYYAENTPDALDAAQTISDVNLVAGTRKYISVKAGEEKWISYTAPKTGSYRFSVNSGSVEVYTALSGDPIGSSSGSETYAVLSAKQTVYIKLSHSGVGTQNMGLLVTFIGSFTAMDFGRELTVPNRNTVYFSFTAPEDAIYEFKAKGANYSRINLYDNANVEGSYIAQGNGSVLTGMKTGETIYVTVWGYSNNGSSFSVVVDKLQSKQLDMDTTLAVTTDTGETAWVVFTAPETNTYTFTMKKEEYSSEVYNYIGFYKSIPGEAVNNSVFRSGEDTYECELAKDEKLYLQVRGNYSSSKADVSISVKKRFETLTAGKAISAALASGESQWYVFQAEAAGYYRFAAKAADDVSGSSVTLYGDKNGYRYIAGNSGSYPGTELVHGLKKDEIVYVKVDGNGNAASLQVSVSRVEAAAMNADTAISLEAGAERILEFTVPKDGWYQFAVSSGAADASQSAQFVVVSLAQGVVVDRSLSSSATSDTVLLNKGDVLLLQVLETNGTTAAFSLKITEKAATVLTTAQPAALAASEEWVSFTAAETTLYTFSSVYADGVQGRNSMIYYKWNTEGSYFESNTITSSANNPLTLSVVVKAGETIFWAISSADTTPVTLKVEKNTISVLSVGGSGENLSLQEGEEALLVFTANQAGTYQFYSTSEGDPRVKLYHSLEDTDYFAEDDDGRGVGNNFSISYQMAAGETVYLLVHGWSHNSVDFTVHTERVVG